MATNKKPQNVAVGDNLEFNEEYPIYHIEKGQACVVRELLGQTHANVHVDQGSGIIIAVPLADLREPTATTPAVSE